MPYFWNPSLVLPNAYSHKNGELNAFLGFQPNDWSICETNVFDNPLICLCSSILFLSNALIYAHTISKCCPIISKKTIKSLLL